MGEPDPLAIKVIKTLGERDLTLATAESLTGGLIGATLTTVPGASKVFMGGAITYDTGLKRAMLGVNAADIRAFSVVSEQVASEMAVGAQRLTGADWTIAVTGVAGPDPQDGHAPGEVWICVLGPRIASQAAPQQSEQYQFEGDRAAIREATVQAALGMLLRILSPV